MTQKIIRMTTRRLQTCLPFILLAIVLITPALATNPEGIQPEKAPETIALSPENMVGKNSADTEKSSLVGSLGDVAETISDTVSETLAEDRANQQEESEADVEAPSPGSEQVKKTGATILPLPSAPDTGLTAAQQENKKINEAFLSSLMRELQEHPAKPIDIVLVLLATGLFLYVARHLNSFRPRLLAFCEQWQDMNLPSLTVGKMEVLSDEQLSRVVTVAIRGLYWATLVTLFLIYLGFVFSLFPATQFIVGESVRYILKLTLFFWRSLTAFVPNLLSIVTIIIVANLIMRLMEVLARALYLEQINIRGFYKEWIYPTFKIARTLVIIFAVVMIAPYLPGYDSPAFQGMTVFLGVLLSLGSSSAVANLVAGVVLVYMRPFKVGDRVRIGRDDTVVGDIVEMSFLVTRLRTTKNEDITVPNAMVLGGAMTNYSSSGKHRGLILHTTVTIGYDVPWQKVHELLLAAAAKTDHVMMDCDPEASKDSIRCTDPFVLQKSLDDFYVAYELNAYTDEPQKMNQTYSELHKHILDTFNAAGVEILSPHYAAQRSGQDVAIPEAKATTPGFPFRFSQV